MHPVLCFRLLCASARPPLAFSFRSFPVVSSVSFRPIPCRAASVSFRFFRVKSSFGFVLGDKSAFHVSRFVSVPFCNLLSYHPQPLTCLQCRREVAYDREHVEYVALEWLVVSHKMFLQFQLQQRRQRRCVGA